jgi:hypothetical protein
MLAAAVTCTVVASAVVFLVANAASQPRVSTTRQLQVIGAAATNQSHGAWFVDLQAGNVIFCERVAAGVQCQTAAIP